MDYTKHGEFGGGDLKRPPPVPNHNGSANVTRVEATQALPTLQIAVNLTKDHYKLYGVAGTIFAVVLLVFSQIDGLAIFSSVPATLLNAGFMYLFRKQIETKNAELTDLLWVFQDMRVLLKLLPILIMGIAIGAIEYFLTSQMGFLGTIIELFMMLLLFALTAFAVPLVIFQNVPVAAAIQANVEATTLNWEYLLITGLMLTGLCVLCAILLVAPLLLFAFPVSLVAGYLMYALIFESATLERFK